MTPLSTHGHFWLPDEPARRVSGQLMFDGSEIRLTLFESLAVQEWPETGVVFGGPKREEHERVFGRIFTDEADQVSSANPEQVTLMGVSAFTMQFPSAETTQTWAADSLLLGVHSQEQTARRVRLYFDALPAWCNSPWLVKSVGADGSFSATTESITMHDARLDNAGVTVTASCKGTWGRDVHLDRETYIEIAPDEVTPLATTHSDWARPFHDLLLLSLGVAVSLTDVRVEVADTYGQHRFASLLFGANQNDSPRSFDPHRLREDDSLCLLFPEDAGADFESVLPEWMALREDLNSVIDQYTAVYYASFMYAENRYTHFFKAAEELAKRAFDTAELPKESHKARVKAILRAARDGEVPEEHVSWAERVLSSRNDLPLRTVIKMLIDDAGEPGKYLMEWVPDADKRIASARTAHGGMKSSGVEQFWLGTVLAFLLRLHLLREIGVDPRTIERRVLAARMFRRAVAALSKSATASD